MGTRGLTNISPRKTKPSFPIQASPKASAKSSAKAPERSLSNAELNLIENNFLSLPENKIDEIVEMLPLKEDEDEDEVSIDIQSLTSDLQWKILTMIKEHFKFDEKTLKGETIESLTTKGLVKPQIESSDAE